VNRTSTSAVHIVATPTDRTVARIAAHLARLAAGHDPMGHLFAIERLARAARSEWREAQHHPDPEPQS
jgi:hypothetical protein